MAKTDLSIPSLGNKFVDLRDTIPGDSYNWSWVRPLSEVNYLAIHHTGGADTETAEDIANSHINKNGWGGIGYHFLIARDGTVFYVGDISTARANVANLNEQVLGIGLIGNFISRSETVPRFIQGKGPSTEQIDSCHKLCEFFINTYPPLVNIKSWDKVRGHKELPDQSTPCPGDNWPQVRIQIVEGITPAPEVQSRIVFNPPLDQTFEEDQNLEKENLRSQVNSLQSSLAAVNQQVISLQETLAEREQELNHLKSFTPTPMVTIPVEQKPQVDTTLTIVGAMINFYLFLFSEGKQSNGLFPPRKVE